MYIVYLDNCSYAVSKDTFDAKNFIGANVFDPETNEMFIVASNTMIKLGEETTSNPEIIPGGGSLPDGPIFDPVEEETPVEEEVPSEEEITE